MPAADQLAVIDRHLPADTVNGDLRRRAARALLAAGGSMLRATLFAVLPLRPWQGIALNHRAFRGRGLRIALAPWLCAELGLPDPDPDPLADVRAAVANARNLYAVGERPIGSESERNPS